VVGAMKTTTSPEQTAQLGSELASRLLPGDVILLSGDLGAGKTTFVQGLGRGLGVMQTIQSPTFTVIAEYRAILGGSVVTLAHLDLYRLEPGEATFSAGVEDFLDRDDNISVIEWPDRLPIQPDAPIWRIAIRTIAADTRQITIEGPDRG
jgi:tRNA threonylcarbamoyladenosine biosynthesis protein TsaE